MEGSTTPSRETDKYAPREDDGLQVVEHQEIRPKRVAEDAPELNIHNEETAPKYLGTTPDLGYGADAPEHAGPGTAMLSDDEKGAHLGQSPERRYLGMRKKTFWIVCIVAAILLLAAVLGGVLGGVLSKKHSNNGNSDQSQNQTVQQLPATLGSGLASSVTSDGTTLVYYQVYDEGANSASIYEALYTNSSLQSGGYNASEINLVASDAGAGKPMAAISYELSGQSWRQVFYVSDRNILQQVNMTTSVGNGTWGTPWTVIFFLAENASPALAACYLDQNIYSNNGIRVYYANATSSQIQELKYTFGQADGHWSEGRTFEGSDSASGVGCTTFSGPSGNVRGTSNQDYLNVYLRNASTGGLIQQYQTWINGTADGWYSIPDVAPNATVNQGSSIAAVGDGTYDYVFWEEAPGEFTRGSVYPSEANPMFDIVSEGQGTINSHLTAAALGGNRTMFLAQDTAAQIWAYEFTTDISSELNVTLTATVAMESNSTT